MPLAATLKAVPDQVLDMIGTTQDLILASASSFVDAGKSISKKLPTVPALPFADQLPTPGAVATGTFSFAEKLLASQKEFSLKLIDTYMPAPKPAAKATATKSA